MKKGIKLDSIDNVGVVLEDISADDEVKMGELVIRATEDIKMPHKIALQNIEAGETIFKYGEIIGYATENIRQGQWVHVHNLDSEKIMK